MKIIKKKSSDYNTVNTAAICQYIKEYSGKIETMIQNEVQLKTINRTTLKSVAAGLETVVKRLEYSLESK